MLRDGASSIYGSDAVAGVVNYVMDMRYRGSELVLRYADTEDGGGREFRATARYGTTFAKNKGRFVATADVFDREIIFASQRSFSADADHTNLAPPPWDNYATGTSFFARSTGSAYGNFTIGTLSSTGAFTGTRPTGGPRHSPPPRDPFSLCRRSPGWASRIRRPHAWESSATITTTSALRV